MCNDDEVASFSGPFSSSSSFSSQTLNMNKTLNIRSEKKRGTFFAFFEFSSKFFQRKD
mgnify:CR=1 FL=1|jgi:hypothetical protein